MAALYHTYFLSCPLAYACQSNGFCPPGRMKGQRVVPDSTPLPPAARRSIQIKVYVPALEKEIEF